MIFQFESFRTNSEKNPEKFSASLSRAENDEFRKTILHLQLNPPNSPLQASENFIFSLLETYRSVDLFGKALSAQLN